MNDRYDEEYFERGLITGRSCYMNYHWMPELTLRMAHHLIIKLGLRPDHRVLDYGCAKGFLVKALRILGVQAWGCDISRYAIEHAEVEVRPYCVLMDGCSIPFDCNFDWVISKDVLEHMTVPVLRSFLDASAKQCHRAFHAIPLGDGDHFVVPEYQRDATHMLAKPVPWWVDRFVQTGWRLRNFAFTMVGMKENWTAFYERGNGFFELEAVTDES